MILLLSGCVFFVGALMALYPERIAAFGLRHAFWEPSERYRRQSVTRIRIVGFLWMLFAIVLTGIDFFR